MWRKDMYGWAEHKQAAWRQRMLLGGGYEGRGDMIGTPFAMWWRGKTAAMHDMRGRRLTWGVKW